MVATVTIAAVVCCVFIHNLGLQLTWKFYHWLPKKLPLRLGIALYCILLVHMIEIFIFGVGFKLLNADNYGLVSTQPMVWDFWTICYYSGAVYTTVGFGDIVPVGTIRLYTIAEALTGLMLVSWSASFTFLAMHEEFKERKVVIENDL
jgi:hypothetical protein